VALLVLRGTSILQVIIWVLL